MNTKQKKCARCQVSKKLTEYYDDKRSYCIDCERETARERMRKYNQTFNGRAMQAYHDAKKAARKWGAHDDLTPHDVLFTFAISEGECSYCGNVTEDYELEHVVPLSSGGANTLSNITVACPSCNRSKHNRALLTWHERTDRTENDEILKTIDRMALRRGVSRLVIIDELQKQASEYTFKDVDK